jgi:hypothetical protein
MWNGGDPTWKNYMEKLLAKASGFLGTEAKTGE